LKGLTQPTIHTALIPVSLTYVLLGHSNTSMTARYAHHLTVQRKLEIISLLKLPESR